MCSLSWLCINYTYGCFRLDFDGSFIKWLLSLWSSFTQTFSSLCFSEDRSSRLSSRPAVFWPKYPWNNGYERWRLSGPSSRFPWCCCSSLVGISPGKETPLSEKQKSSVHSFVFLWCLSTPHRSRSVVRIYTTVRFEPSKINIFVKDCQRGGKDVTCMSAIVCFNITARTALPPTQEIGEPVKIICCRGSNSVKFPCSSHLSFSQCLASSHG